VDVSASAALKMLSTVAAHGVSSGATAYSGGSPSGTVSDSFLHTYDALPRVPSAWY